MKKKLSNDIKTYYDSRISLFGSTFKGVDWNSKKSQYIRFNQISKVINEPIKSNFSIIDFGCGYGEYINFINQNFSNFKYFGFDFSDKMIEKAKKKFNLNNVHFYTRLKEVEIKDYLISSGVFNVKLKESDTNFKNYFIRLLNKFNSLSKKGFAFNALPSVTDKKYKKDYLFYKNPLFFYNYCKNNFSKDVTLLENYGLFDYTILVKK